MAMANMHERRPSHLLSGHLSLPSSDGTGRGYVHPSWPGVTAFKGEPYDARPIPLNEVVVSANIEDGIVRRALSDSQPSLGEGAVSSLSIESNQSAPVDDRSENSEDNRQQVLDENAPRSDTAFGC